ncbi:MAG TPA: hypothetical protein DCY27_13215 [Desulfobacterales bacterium]|nr:hypothetical protein [Desulfobacterales bacterium]
MRSFSELLAERQGAVSLKPGRPAVKFATGAKLKEMFGEIPAATTVGNLLVTTQCVDDRHDIYKVVIRLVILFF